MEVITDEWAKIQILQEDELTGLKEHPFPEDCKGDRGTTLNEVIGSMEKDKTIPLMDIGTL